MNLGFDADTVGAVAGGLAGLFYGYQAIPEDWLKVLQKREWVEDLCTWDYQSPIPVTDIHAHLIPGIDDGSVDMNMTMDMIRCEYRQGVRGILCTPHGEDIISIEKLKKGWDEIRSRCDELYPDLELGLGCELYLYPGNVKASIERLRQGTYLPLNGTKYVLVDFLGTDAHRLFHRPPKVAGGMKELMKIADLDYAKKIAFQNAQDLLMI